MGRLNFTERNMRRIGEKLKRLRIKKGYTSYENFAYEHDIPRVQYWRLENGANFTMKYLLRILEIHKISLYKFFDKEFEDFKG